MVSMPRRRRARWQHPSPRRSLSSSGGHGNRRGMSTSGRGPHDARAELPASRRRGPARAARSRGAPYRAGNGCAGSRARRLVLVGHHRRARRRDRRPSRRSGVAKRRAGIRDQPRDLGRVEEPALRAVGERRGEHSALAAPRPDREPDEQQEAGDHQEEVGGTKRCAVVEEQRAVPGRVGADRDAGSRSAARGPAPPAAAAHRDADPDAGERGEERVRERAEHAADHEQPDRAPEAAGLAVAARCTPPRGRGCSR